MRRWIEIIVALIIVVPLTQIVIGDITAADGFVTNSTATSVGNDGGFVQMLFEWWAVGFGLIIILIAVFVIRAKWGQGFGGFGGGGGQGQ